MLLLSAETIQLEGPKRDYVFSQDWFSHHIPAWATLIQRFRPHRVLEVGCFEGRATTYLIEACSGFGPLQIACVDTWQGSVDLPPHVMDGVEANFDRNIALAIRRALAPVTFKKLRRSSAVALAELIASDEAQFDLIYIDGSHVAPDVMMDAVLAFQLLRIGGLMIFDDYLWSMERPFDADALNMPKPAIDAFTMIFMHKVRVLPGFPNDQCYIEKLGA